MNDEMLKIKLEEYGVPQNRIEDFLNDLQTGDLLNPVPDLKIDRSKDKLVEEIRLKQMLINEPDWRNKARIASMIISLNLD
jgi:hypothetical protein